MPPRRTRLPDPAVLSTLLNLVLVAGGAFLAVFPACLTVPAGLGLMGYGIHRFRRREAKADLAKQLDDS